MCEGVCLKLKDLGKLNIMTIDRQPLLLIRFTHKCLRVV